MFHEDESAEPASEAMETEAETVWCNSPPSVPCVLKFVPRSFEDLRGRRHLWTFEWALLEAQTDSLRKMFTYSFEQSFYSDVEVWGVGLFYHRTA